MTTTTRRKRLLGSGRPAAVRRALLALMMVASVVVGFEPGAGANESESQALISESSVLFSGSKSVSRVPGLEYRKSDIVGYYPEDGSYAMVFDGSDVGLIKDLDGFVPLSDGGILLTFDQPFDHPELGRVDEADIIRFVPSALGEDTAGSVEWFLDGSDVGLDTANEEVDSIAVSPDGRLLISTRRRLNDGDFEARSQDLVVLDNARYGMDSAGTWELYFDGSQTGLGRSSEQIRGAAVDAATGVIHLKTQGSVKTPDFRATSHKVVSCDPSSLAPDTTGCEFSLLAEEMGAKNLDALHVGLPATLGGCDPQDELTIDSHTPGERIDVTETGTGTGSFLLSGVAPNGTTVVTLAIDDETGPTELTPDPCAPDWSIEVAAVRSGTFTLTMTAMGPFGQVQTSIDLEIVAADEDDVLVQPEFADTPQFHDRLVSLDDETGTLVFEGDITGEINPSDGLGGGPSAIAPEGYLKIVVGAEFDGTNTVVTTRQAGLTELVRQIDIDFAIDPGEVEPIIIETGVGAEAAAPAPAAAPKAGDLFAAATRAQGGPSSQPQAQINPDENTELNLVFDIDPGVEFELDIDWEKPCWICPRIRPVLKTFWFEGSLEFTAKAELTHRANGITTGKVPFGPSFDDYRLGGFSIPTPIGIPVTFTFEAESQAFYELTLSAGFKLEYQITFRIEAGFEHKSDGSGRGTYRDGSFTGDAPELDIDLGVIFEAAAGLEIDFEVLLYGQAGIELEASPQIEFEAVGDLIDREIKWELKLVVPFEAGIEIEIKIGPIGWEREFGDLEFLVLSLTLFEGTLFTDDGEPSLAISHTGPPGAFPGQAYTYTVNVDNTGDGEATGVTVTIDLPDVGSFISSSPPGSPASPSPGSTYTVDLGDIEAGGTKSVTLRWRAPTPGGVDATSSASADADNAPSVGPAVATVPIGLVSNCNPCGATAAGVGLRNRSQGTITIGDLPPGVTVTRAVLVWGILYDGAVPRNSITLNGTEVTADVASTISGTLCWGDSATVGYAADVTSLVNGNGSYTVSDPPRGITRVDDDPAGVLPYTDGASLVVFYVGGGSNSQVLSDFTYNTNTAEPIVRSFDEVNSGGFGARLTLAGPDGQGNGGEVFTITGAGSPIVLQDTWDGSDPQEGPSFPIGNLWDTDTYDVSSILPAGQSTLTFRHQQTADCIGVGATVLVVDQSVAG